MAVSLWCSLVKQYLVSENLEMHEIIEFQTVNPSETRRKSNITSKDFIGNASIFQIDIEIRNLSVSDLGWVLCKSWRAYLPHYDSLTLNIEMKPYFISPFLTSRKKSSEGKYEIHYDFTIHGYPLDNLNVGLFRNEENIANCTWTRSKYPTLVSSPDCNEREPPAGLEIKIKPGSEFHRVNIRLIIGNISMGRFGWFKLEVCNGIGCNSDHFHLPNPSKPLELWPIIVMICIVVIFLLLIVYWFVRRQRRQKLKQKEIGQVEKEMEQRYSNLPIHKAHNLQIISELGEGVFGKVHLALFGKDPDSTDEESKRVAVKSLKDFSLPHCSKFLQEAELLAQLDHPNIVIFNGVSIDENDLLLIFEFMEAGDLTSYLRERGPNARLLTSEPKQALTHMELLQLALQAARGLGYLGKMKIVHRDLAARNCLLRNMEASQIQLKLSDFGMSRRLYTRDYYRMRDLKELLPVRWLPPESLTFGVFTQESDIWSFGVLLWEIFSFGQIPYPSLSNSEVVEAMKTGTTLESPDDCPGQIYALMQRCWRQVPEERISVEEMEAELTRSIVPCRGQRTLKGQAAMSESELKKKLEKRQRTSSVSDSTVTQQKPHVYVRADMSGYIEWDKNEGAERVQRRRSRSGPITPTEKTQVQ